MEWPLGSWMTNQSKFLGWDPKQGSQPFPLYLGTGGDPQKFSKFKFKFKFYFRVCHVTPCLKDILQEIKNLLVKIVSLVYRGSQILRTISLCYNWQNSPTSQHGTILAILAN